MIEAINILLQQVSKNIPLILACTFLVIVGGMWWESGGALVARHALAQRRWGLISLGWALVFAPLLLLGYLLDQSLSWWYIFCAVIGASACIFLVKVIVDATTIDLNTATEQELGRLPMISPYLAHQIVAYRKEHKGFHAIEELQCVPDIDRRLFEWIKENVRVTNVIDQRSGRENFPHVYALHASVQANPPVPQPQPQAPMPLTRPQANLPAPRAPIQVPQPFARAQANLPTPRVSMEVQAPLARTQTNHLARRAPVEAATPLADAHAVQQSNSPRVIERSPQKTSGSPVRGIRNHRKRQTMSDTPKTK